MKPRIFTWMGIVLMILLITSGTVFSQNQVTNADDLFEMSLEDLLNQNVTTVSKSVEKALDAPGMVEVLTRDDIARFGGNTLSSILERIPGLTATSAAVSDRSIMSIRGEQTTASSNHVLLLIDGRPVRETLEGGVSSEMYESFPVNVIERIEVIKGPGSVLYGSNAFSGVINIITQKAEKTSMTVTGMSGSSGTLGASVNLNVSSGDLKIVAAGKYLKKPDWSINYAYNANDLNANPNTFDSTGVNGATVGNDPSMVDTSMNGNQGSMQMLNSGVTIPNESAALFLSANYKNLSFMTSYNQWQTTGFDSPGMAVWEKSFSNVGYDLKFNQNWNSNINVSFTNAQFETDSFPNLHRNSYELLAEWTHFVTLSQKSKLFFGGLYSLTKGKETNTIYNEEYVGIDAQRKSTAVYAQADYQLLKTLKLIGGVQLNKIENIDMDLVPRAGLIWNLTSQLNFKALYGQAFRAPSLNESYLNQPFSLGNSALEPEKVGTVDLGANFIGDHIQLGVSYFHSKLYNIISLDRTYTIPTYENMGEVVLQGGELEGKYYFNRNIYFTGSALYQTTKNSEGESNVTSIANLSGKAGLSYQSDRGVSVSLFDIFQGKLDDSFKTDSNVSPEKAYNKLNLHCSLDVNQLMRSEIKQKVSLFVHADNLLNRQIWLPAWGDDSGKSIPFDQGRVVYAGFNIAF